MLRQYRSISLCITWRISMMTPKLHVFAIALWAPLFLFATAAEAEYVKESKPAGNCNTHYKNGSGVACSGITGAGALNTTCATAGSPTVTSPKGLSGVSITWAEGGDGAYIWTTVSGCDPSPSKCSITCGKTTNEPTASSTTHQADLIANYVGALLSVYAADTSPDVSNAVSDTIDALNAVPLGTNYNSTLQSAAISELSGLSGSSIIESQLTDTATVEEAMHNDFLEVSVPALSKEGMAVFLCMAVLIGIAMLLKAQRGRRG